jgi:hypothetical protein
MPADIAPFVNDATHFRSAVADFPGCLTADLTDALHRHAREFLEGQAITGELPVWQPPTNSEPPSASRFIVSEKNAKAVVQVGPRAAIAIPKSEEGCLCPTLSPLLSHLRIRFLQRGA